MEIKDSLVIDLRNQKDPIEPLKNTRNVPERWKPEFFKWIPLDIEKPDPLYAYNECIEEKICGCDGTEPFVSVLFTDGKQLFEDVGWNGEEWDKHIPFIPTHYIYIPMTPDRDKLYKE